MKDIIFEDFDRFVENILTQTPVNDSGRVNTFRVRRVLDTGARDGVIAPPTFIGAQYEKRPYSPGDGIAYTIDSIQSQANRMERVLVRILDDLIPKGTVRASDGIVHDIRVAAGHRIADQILSKTDKADFVAKALEAFAKDRDFLAIARLDVPSLLFGLDDRSGSRGKWARMITSEIYATDCHDTGQRGYTYKPIYSREESSDDDVGVNPNFPPELLGYIPRGEKASSVLLDAIPGFDKNQRGEKFPSGIYVGGECIQKILFQFSHCIAIYNKGDAASKMLARFLVAAGIAVMLEEPELDLRSGCCLEVATEEAVFTLKNRVREEVVVDSGELHKKVIPYLEKVAKEFKELSKWENWDAKVVPKAKVSKAPKPTKTSETEK